MMHFKRHQIINQAFLREVLITFMRKHLQQFDCSTPRFPFHDLCALEYSSSWNSLITPYKYLPLLLLLREVPGQVQSSTALSYISLLPKTLLKCVEQGPNSLMDSCIIKYSPVHLKHQIVSFNEIVCVKLSDLEVK